jgi:hypothetical protein
VLWTGLVLLIATNGIVLAGALYNRAGQPEATLGLSQRELELPWRSGFERENSGISLEMRWRIPRPATGDETYEQGVPWLDKAKLRELGFDVSRSFGTASGKRYYAKQLPREVFLVLEFDGAAYRAAVQRAETREKRAAERATANPGAVELKRALDSANRDLESERERVSRLFVVDAGLDAAALRAKYPDRSHYAIVPGLVRLASYRRGMDDVPVGYVEDLSVASVNVPALYRAPFASAYKQTGEPRPGAGNFKVTVAFGKRLEPWIVDLQRAVK